MERVFGVSGLAAWLISGAGPATDAGRDMAFKCISLILAKFHGRYARCWNPFELASEARPINTDLSKHR
jgi:hypothetical protein